MKKRKSLVLLVTAQMIVKMKKYFLFIVFFSALSNAQIQQVFTGQNPGLNRTEIYRPNSPTNNVGNRDVLGWTKADDVYYMSMDTIRFDALKSSFNKGNPSGFIWSDGLGNLKHSPKSELTLPYFQLTGVPSTFTPEAHAHTISDVTGLQTELDSKTSSPAGAVIFFAGSSAPTGYLLCDGSAVSRSTYSNLFSAIGTTYGSGDGTTTFNLPDMRQRFPLMKSSSGTGSTLGATGGNIDHTHAVDPPNTTSTTAPNINNVTLLALGSASSPSHTHDVNIAQFNSGASNPPFLVLNAIIKY